MIARLLNGNPEAVTARLPLLIVPAFAACLLSANFDLPGLLSFAQLFALSVSAASFTNYRTERGLWMLAALFFSIWTSIFFMWIFGQSRDLMRGVAPPASLIIDGAVALFVIRIHLKFLWTTAKFNFALSRSTTNG